MAPDHDRTVSIGEVARRSGSSVRAVRYYEQHGLIGARRTPAGHRRFPPEAIETTRRIRLLLDAGLPLAVAAQVMPCFVDEGARLEACVAEHLSRRLQTVQDRMDELDEQRASLERLRSLIAG